MTDVLPDDYKIYADYIYVVDGKEYVSDWHDITVKELKARENFKEVRGYDVYARAADLYEDVKDS